MEIKGKLIKKDKSEYPRFMDEATIELSPRELLEQIPHKQIGELLEMINLPQPQQKAQYPCCFQYHREDLKCPIHDKPQQSLCECCGQPLDKILGKREERKPQQELCVPKETLEYLASFKCDNPMACGQGAICNSCWVSSWAKGILSTCKPIPPQSEGKFNPQSMDAKVWAKEFMRVYNLSLVCDIDEDRVKTWFANAIMAGFDEANRRSKKPELASERDYWDDYKDWLKRLKDGDKGKPETKIEELCIYDAVQPKDKLIMNKINELIQAFNSRKEQE